MALYIRLGISGTGLLEREKFIRKIDYASVMLEKLMFIPREYQLWLNAPLRELDGELITKGREKIVNFYNLKENDYKRLFYKIEGLIGLNNKEFPATLTIHDRRFRKIYGDIELDTSMVPLEDILLDDKPFVERLKALFRDKHLKGVSVAWAFIGDSPDAVIDVRERIFSYHPKPSFLIEDMFKTIKHESEETGGIEFLKFFSPYNLSFLAYKISSLKEFGRFLNDLTEEVDLTKEEGSLILVAKDRKSFRDFYISFVDDFLNSIKEEWPVESKIEEILQRWISKRQRTINSFSKLDR